MNQRATAAQPFEIVSFLASQFTILSTLVSYHRIIRYSAFPA